MKRLATAGVVIAITATATVLGGLFGSSSSTPAATEYTVQPGPSDLLERRITQTQQRLRDVPGDWTAWAGLGLAYLEHARVTTDPTYYPKADEAVRRSFAIRPDGNTEALVARGGLANARHNFAAARTDALAALSVNAYHADAYAVLADAETQLGNPTAATDAVQHLLDLRPGLSGYARASYDLEQRGHVDQAADLMRRALAAAADRHDIAFCHNQLGDLAWAAGDLSGADSEYTAGLRADPDSAALRRGLARVAAATGQTTQALAGYATVTLRSPTPGYLLEYAEHLRAAGRDADAHVQLTLALAAHRLFLVNGGTDGVTGAALAEADGRPADALAEARAEWSRRAHADVADALAWALHLSHQDGAALPFALRASATGARSAAYAYHLGMIQRGLGDRAAAVASLSRALATNPRFSPLDAPIAERTLAALTHTPEIPT